MTFYCSLLFFQLQQYIQVKVKSCYQCDESAIKNRTFVVKPKFNVFTVIY